MTIPVWARWALGLSLLVFASARLRLPLPTALAQRWLAANAPEFALDHGRQWLRWGSGELLLEDVVVDFRGQRRLRAQRIELRVDLWPWSPDFGIPRAVRVQQPELDVDRAFLEALQRTVAQLAQVERDRPPAWLQVELHNLSLRAVDDGGRRWSTTGVQGALDWDALHGARLRLSGELLAPLPGELLLVAAGDPSLQVWRGELRAGARLRPTWKKLQPAGWEWSGAGAQAHATFAADVGGLRALQARCAVQAPRVRGKQPRIAIDDAQFRLEGDLVQGFRFHAEADEVHGRVELEGELRPPAGRDPARLADPAAWTLRAFPSTAEARGTPESIAWLASVDPSLREIADALDALGIDGTGSLRAMVGWHPVARWSWSLEVLPLQLAMSYRGFVDDEGRRIAAPYPLEDCDGVFHAGGKVLMWDARARAGSGRVRSDGTVDVRPADGVGLTVGVHVTDLALDRQAAHALSGNPELNARWRDLGSPLGGTLDLELQVEADARAEADAWIRGRVRGATGTPLALPVETTVEDASFEWRGRDLAFRGRLAALGSRAQVRGAVHEPDGGGAELVLYAAGNAFHPSAQERLALQGYLRLPEAMAPLDLQGDLAYRATLRLDDGEDARPQALVEVDLGGAACFDREVGVGVEDLRGSAAVAWARGGTALAFPEVRTRLPGGEVQGSLRIHPLPQFSRATFSTGQLALDEDFTARLRSIVGLYLFEESVGFSGSVDLRGSFDPMAPRDFRGVLHCQPMRIAAVEEEIREVHELEGDLRLTAESVRADRLQLSGEDSEVWVSGFALSRGPGGGTLLEMQLDATSGVRLDSRLRQLLGAGARDTLRLIGLRGRAVPRGMKVRLEHDGERAQVDVEGGLDVRGMALDTAGGVSDGNARMQLVGRWSGADDYRAELQLRDATAMVSGLQVRDGTGTLVLDPESVALVDFQASALGGTVSSNTFDADGRPAQGEIRLGLGGDAPFHAWLGMRGLQLGRMREELRMGGALSGNLDGDIDLSGQVMRTNSLKGRGQVSIRDGSLGTVPVLRQIWRVAGVRPPVFDQGTLEFRANGVDRFDVDSFRLEHDLMAVQGTGHVRFDSALHLKVTVRTFGAFGDLPILRDVLDWLVEQDVRGPVERPVIFQRSTGKIFNVEPYVPFPLWVPDAGLPDWRRSPIEPAGVR